MSEVALLSMRRLMFAGMSSQRLLPRLRSRNHPWLLRAAQIGGALVVAVAIPGATLLVATHPKHSSGLWAAGLIVVVVLVAIGAAVAIGAGVMAFLTRPAADEHTANLKSSALAVSRSLEAGDPCNYGNGYRPEQAFRAHFGPLTKRLVVWDGRVGLLAEARTALEEHIDMVMAEHGIAEPDFIVEVITPIVRKLAESHARGSAPNRPALVWDGFTTAGQPEIPGPPEGTLRPNGGGGWISLPPEPGETIEDWHARARIYIDRVEAAVDALYVSSLPAAQAIVDAEQRVDAFRRDDHASVLAALELVQIREPPRIRHACESC
jgi:hypothetical protein